MKLIKCILCDSSNLQFVQSNDNFKIFKCLNCDIIYSYPTKSLDNYSSETTHNRWEFTKLLRYVKSYKDVSKLNIFEMGCGDGRFLHEISKLGCFYCGLDINPNAIKSAHTRGLANCICSPLSEKFIERYKDFFHIIFSFHVLEHLDSPRKTINYLNHICNDNGLLFLSVPNPERLSAKIFEENWDTPPYHLTKFSKKSLRYLMENEGFEVIDFLEEPLTFKSAYIYSIDLNNSFIRIMRPLIKFGRFVSKAEGSKFSNYQSYNKRSLIKKIAIRWFSLLATCLGLLFFICLKITSLLLILPSRFNKGLSLVVICKKKVRPNVYL